MSYVHASCGKLIYPIRNGETIYYRETIYYSSEQHIDCAICGGSIQAGDTVVQSNDTDIRRYKEGSFKPQPPKTLDWSSLISDEGALKSVLSELAQQLKPVLGQMVQDLASNKIQTLAAEALHRAGKPIEIQIADLPVKPRSGTSLSPPSFAASLQASIRGLRGLPVPVRQPPPSKPPKP